MELPVSSRYGWRAASSSRGDLLAGGAVLPNRVASPPAIAEQLYIEMLKHGYTAVAEFHYVHHPAEMLARHLEAARDTGIAITLLPSLYRWSGFGATGRLTPV